MVRLSRPPRSMSHRRTRHAWSGWRRKTACRRRGRGHEAMATVMDATQALEARHLLQTYRRQPVTFVRGDGVRLFDSDGKEYLDLLSGIGVASLGHAHQGLARAISEQVQTLIHTSNLFFHPLQGQLAERLANLSG